jgi:hypothetical protein
LWNKIGGWGREERIWNRRGKWRRDDQTDLEIEDCFSNHSNSVETLEQSKDLNELPKHLINKDNSYSDISDSLEDEKTLINK